MAFLPCDVTRHKHRGRNVNLYLGAVHGGLAERYSFRLCVDHWSEIEARLTKFKVDTTSDAVGVPIYSDLCFTCGNPVDKGRWQLFFTAYPPQDERKDYWTRVHDDCSFSQFLPYFDSPQQG